MQLVMDELRGYARLPMEDEVLQTGQDIIRRLKNRGYNIHAPRNDRDSILTHEIHHTDTRTVSRERVALSALRTLGFPQILRTLKFNEDQIN